MAKAEIAAVLALAAALFIAIGDVIHQRSAHDVTDEPVGHVALFSRLLRDGQWWLGSGVAAVGFARLANTKPGLIVLISMMLLLTFWAVLGGHRMMAFVLLLLSATLGAQLWRIEGGQLGASAAAGATTRSGHSPAAP